MSASSITSRSRWAAIGAAVAVTLGAGGVGIGQATTDAGDGPVSAFFPIEPCRLADNIAIAADSSITLDGTGETGDCDLPSDITGLAANVTAVNATQQTNLRVYAQGDDVPATANLNPTPGASPTPNAVNIPLNASNGQFSVYNRFGSIGVFIDVMGYYDDHTHDDRYYTEAEVDALRPFAVAAERVGATFLTATATSVITLDVDAPSDGQVTVNSSALVYHTGAGGDVACIILPSTEPTVFLSPSSLGVQAFEADGVDVDNGTISGTRVFDVGGGTTTTFELRCSEVDGDGGRVEARGLTAIFTPAPPAP